MQWKIEGVPGDIVNNLIAGMSFADDEDAGDRGIERYQAFVGGGLMESSPCLFEDDQMMVCSGSASTCCGIVLAALRLC